MTLQEKRPLITKARPLFISSLTLKGNDDPFIPLPPAIEQATPEEYQALAEKAGIPGSIDRYVSADPYPIPQTKDRDYYQADADAWHWVTGLSDFLRVRSAAERNGISLDNSRYYELGCAAGRVVRHVACQSGAEVWCSDLNVRHTEWIRSFLSPDIKVFHNHGMPHLPLQDNYFDVVTAFSVFTHIDDFEAAWLLELRRILRPGGMAYLTIQSEKTWDAYKQTWIRRQLVDLKDQITEFQIDDALFEGPLPKDKTVFWWPAQEVYNSTVFHTNEYIRREWGRFFDIVDIQQNGHFYQDVVILRKPK